MNTIFDTILRQLGQAYGWSFLVDNADSEDGRRGFTTNLVDVLERTYTALRATTWHDVRTSVAYAAAEAAEGHTARVRDLVCQAEEQLVRYEH